MARLPATPNSSAHPDTLVLLAGGDRHGRLVVARLPSACRCYFEDGGRGGTEEMPKDLPYPRLRFYCSAGGRCCFYVFLIYYKEDFSCFDCDQLIDFPLAGHRYPPLGQNSGRFWPLGFQEFNLLRYVTRTPAGFQSVASLQLVVLVWVLFAVLKECGISWRVLIIIAVITTPGFVRSITGLIYPERNALFLWRF